MEFYKVGLVSDGSLMEINTALITLFVGALYQEHQTSKIFAAYKFNSQVSSMNDTLDYGTYVTVTLVLLPPLCSYVCIMSLLVFGIDDTNY